MVFYLSRTGNAPRTPQLMAFHGHKEAMGQWKIVLFLLAANGRYFCFCSGPLENGLQHGAIAVQSEPGHIPPVTAPLLSSGQPGAR